MANDATLTKPNPVERRAQIAARRAALPDEKRARLEQRLTTAPDHWKGLIPPARRDRPPLCSFAQERLWFVEQMEPDRSIYQVPVAVRVQGELSLPALEQSLSEIVRRHEILRTSFPEFEGRPVQKIADSLELNLQFFDLGRLAEQEREIAVKTLLSRYIARPLLLAEAPLFRVQIVRIACDEHVLILVMHHLISDGWSFQLLISELGLLYSHFSRGAAGVLPELPVQYADFAEWQRQELAGEKVERDLSFWKRQLKDIPSALDLPFDRPRPTFLSHQGSTIDIVLEKELSDRLRRACQDQDVTRFIMLLASFQALLSRYSGQEDLTVGTPVAGRNVQLERLIGLFVNTLVMRADLSGNPTVHEFLMQVKETWLQAQEHQELPFEKLVEELRPERSLSHSPLFQAMFVLQSAPQATRPVEGLTLGTLNVDAGVERFDLTLSVTEEPQRIVCSLGYSTDLFDRATVERIAHHWLQMLDAMIENPERPLKSIALLTPAECRQIVEDWNHTEERYPAQLIHELIETRAQSLPEKIAVSFGYERLSYGELNYRANQLARYLQKLGVRPETRVAVCMQRSPEMVIALLACLKSGAAYVPLDPNYPAERLAYMLSDADAAVLLSHEAVAKLPPHSGQVINIDSEWGCVCRESGAELRVALRPENLAYVIYTSGSTGRPKGAMNTHGGLRNRLQWMQKKYRLSGDDRVLQKTPFSFDVSVWEFFWPLMMGAELIVARPGGHQDPDYLARTIETEQITTVHFVPSMLKAFLESDWAEHCTSLRTIICSGEALGIDAARKAIEMLPADLHNLYGPTEASIDVTSWRCDPANLTRGVFIGKPIANTQVYVLDGEGEPVPVGVAGELHLAGEGLARGYLNRSDATAAAFLPNPFSRHAGHRMYCTGDVVRWTSSGDLDYLGRRDKQVKLRGNRIELGEIEAALKQHPFIKDAVADVREDGGGEKRLVAYLVAREGQLASTAEIRQHLAQKLPLYMVPDYYFRLAGLPLNPSGKLDRSVLPALDEAGREGSDFVTPRNVIEQVVAEIWADVLRVERVGATDNFFHLGGHSLLATRIIARLREYLKVELPLRSMFESRNLAEFAERVEQARGSGRNSAVSPIRATPHFGMLPVSYAQQRLWLIDQLNPNSNSYTLPAGIELKGEINVVALENSLGEIVRRHEGLRTSFVNQGGEPMQVIGPPRPGAIPLVDLSRCQRDEADAEAQRAARESALRGFDLGRGPLLRVALLRLGRERHVELVAMHHIISDGWSMGVLVDEAEALYRDFSHGNPGSLPDLEVQYADYAKWNREWLAGEVLKTELGYWKGQLADAPQILELPVDYPRPARRTRPAEHCRMEFSEALYRSLNQFCRAQGVTLFMVLMAAFQALLARYTGQEQILVGSPVAGRSWLSLEKLIGFFVNMVVLRADFRGQITFRELLAQVRESALGAFAHQELPFEKLVEELKPPRALDRNPIFQAILSLQNAQTQPTQVTLMDSPAKNTANAEAKFDLEAYFWQAPAGLTGSLVFSPELYRPATVARMAEQFVRLLEKAVALPDVPLSDHVLMSEEQRARVLTEWNQTAVEFPGESCIHHLFDQQVLANPDAIAMESDNEEISYSELSRRSNILSRYLQENGVGPEVRVGILLERSTDMISAILGVAKAGGVYVPLNTADPVQRIQFILEDAGVSVLLTTTRIAEQLPSSNLKVIRVDGEQDRREMMHSVAESVPLSTATGSNLAYVMYTSGSTGTPKGVCITHRNILRLVSGARYADLNSGQVVLQFAPVSFDASTFEIWGCLLHGGRLAIFPANMPDLSELGAFIEKHQVTTVWLTAGLFHQMVDGNLNGLKTVRQLLAGGEALSKSHVRRVLAELKTCNLVNGYGPTEATTFACCHRVTETDSGASVPIGRPISNTSIYVLHQGMVPAAVGERGEIFIGGEGLARGYLNRPDLTAERFVPDPFAAEHGARLYRTGDMARYLDDGIIEFLGRSDGQIKLRGFRIELGEIEAALLLHPEISQATVVPREDVQGDKRIVAYIVGKGGAAPTSESIKTFLKQRLPEYMLPALCVALETLPLTQNGKVDKAALPVPDRSLIKSDRKFVAAANALQEQLVAIWEELLGIRPIGIQDDFFELGGHSLLAVQLISRIEERLGRRLPMASLFQSPTIENLSSLLGNDAPLAHDSSLIVPIQPNGAGPRLFFVHAAGGTVFCYADLARHLGESQPFFGIQARTVAEKDAPAHTELEAMATEYVAALRAAQPAGPYYLGGWSMGGVIAFEMARQLKQQKQKVALLTLIDAEAPSKKAVEYKWVVLLGSFATDLGIPLGTLKASWDQIFSLPPMLQLNRIWTEARKAQLVPADMTMAAFRKLFDSFKTNAQMMRSYAGGHYDGPVTLLRAEKPVEYVGKQTPEDYQMDAEPTKGWKQWSGQEVELHVVAGQHYTMMKEPHVKSLAERLKFCIQNAERGL